MTQDVGLTAGQFTDALTGNIGPFLRWDNSAPARRTASSVTPARCTT